MSRTGPFLAACLAAAAPPAGAAVSFQAAPTHPVADGGLLRAPVVGDLNRDGRNDIAVIADGVRIMLGLGDGRLAEGASLPAEDRPADLALADFNGDTILDIAVANSRSSSNVTVALGDGDATFTLASSVPVGTYPVSVVTGDGNGDGKHDLATANAYDGDGKPGLVVSNYNFTIMLVRNTSP